MQKWGLLGCEELLLGLRLELGLMDVGVWNGLGCGHLLKMIIWLRSWLNIHTTTWPFHQHLLILYLFNHHWMIIATCANYALLLLSRLTSVLLLLLLVLLDLLCHHKLLVLWLLLCSCSSLLLFYNILLSYLSNVWRKLTCRDVMQFLMMDKDLGWEAFQNPSMSESFIRRHASSWIPIEASLDKVNEGLIFTL